TQARACSMHVMPKLHRTCRVYSAFLTNPLRLSYSLCVFSNFMQFIFGYSNLRGISLFLGLLMDVVRADQIICMGLLQCERHLQQHQRRAMGALWMQRLFLYRYDDG